MKKLMLYVSLLFFVILFSPGLAVPQEGGISEDYLIQLKRRQEIIAKARAQFQGNALAREHEGGISEDYLIYPSDVLELSVYGESELTRKLVVRPDGKISFPLLGDIEVAGHSTSEVKAIVDKKVSAFIPEASSTVIIDQLGSLKYYVVGEVPNPGMFNVSNQITVLQALSLAGGFKTFADQNSIKIIRGHGENTKKIHFDYSQVRKGKHLEQNILLERGDVVLVP